jgi:phosphatidylglycerophosphatase A
MASELGSHHHVALLVVGGDYRGLRRQLPHPASSSPARLGFMIVQIATLGPLGRLKAPGTWGSAAGLLWWALVVRLAHAKGGPHEFIFDALVVVMAILVCGVAAAFIGKKDPSEIILDEFAAMPLVFLFNPYVYGGKSSLLLIVLGFLLFRLFDITKPFGIKALEKLPGGLGIVLDDVMAAIYANLALHGIALLWAAL